MTTRKGGKPNLPKLMTTREFSAKYGHGWRWAWNLIQENRIPAAQKVGPMYVIPEDALVVPKFAEGLPMSVIDFIPEKLGKLHTGEDVEVPEPKARPNTIGVAPYRQKLVYLPSLKRLRLANELSQDTLGRKAQVATNTIRRAEHGRGVTALSAVKLAYALNVDYEELMRDG